MPSQPADDPTVDPAADPAFAVLPGAPGSPVVVHVPHASRRVPAEARRSIVLDDTALELELDAMTDADTDVLAALAVAGTGAWRFVNRRSRLVVDPERFTEPGAEEMTVVGMGAVYTGTSTLDVLRAPDPARDAALVAAYFAPYADALADLVDDRLAATGRCVVVDLHSYPRHALPYERHADDRRPPVCLGTDADHTPAGLTALARRCFADAGLAGPGDVVTDEPFRGTYVPLRHYRRDAAVSSLMIELRRDVVADTAPTTGGRARVVAAIADLLTRLSDDPAALG